MEIKEGDWVIITEDGLEREELMNELNQRIANMFPQVKAVQKRKRQNIIQPVKVLRIYLDSHSYKTNIVLENGTINDMHIRNGYYRKATEAEIKGHKISKLF